MNHGCEKDLGSLVTAICNKFSTFVWIDFGLNLGMEKYLLKFKHLSPQPKDGYATGHRPLHIFR